MKVLLCLLSEQHVPNLLSVHHYRPDRLVLVETTGMQNRSIASRFQSALKFGGLDYTNKCDIELLDAEDNLDSVRAVLARTFGRYSSAEWVANVTGGTKPMSIAAFEFFKAKGHKVVYTNFARPNVLLSLDSSDESPCHHELSIKEFLAGYGFDSTKKDASLRQAESQARDLAECSRIIAACSSSQGLLQLSDKERDNARKKGCEIQPGQFVSPSPDVVSVVRSAFELKGDENAASLHGKVNKYAAQFLTGGWLEVFFWDLLSRNAKSLGIWDVRLGLEVTRAGDNSGNDFDVAFMHEYGLAMVECKSGSQAHDPGSDILYKIEAVTRQFRALRVRSYLATTGTNIFDKQTHQVKSSVTNRAAIYNCRLLTESQIQNLAKATPAAQAEEIRRVLFNTAETK
jgi:hypothetical protein